VTNDDQKSVLDVIGWCKELENRLVKLENAPDHHVETGTFDLSNDAVLINGEGARKVKRTITYDSPFKSKPILIPNIAAFFLDKDAEATMMVYAKNESNKGADIYVRAWKDSKLYYAEIKWLAIEVSK